MPHIKRWLLIKSGNLKPEQPEGWLARLLENPGAEVFKDLIETAEIVEASKNNPESGVEQSLIHLLAREVGLLGVYVRKRG